MCINTMLNKNDTGNAVQAADGQNLKNEKPKLK